MGKQTKDLSEKYYKFIQEHPKGHFMQSPGWAKLKSEWKNETISVEDENGQLKGSMSLLIRKLPFLSSTIMYSPRGPICDPHDSETIKGLLEKAKIIAKKHKSYVLKMDPDIEIEDQRFIEIVKEHGFTVKQGLGNYDGIQPRFVFRLDLRNMTEEKLMQSFHSKTRYNIRLAQRRGVVCKSGSREDISVFHQLIVETGVRDGFIVRNQDYYENFYDFLGSEHVRVFIASYEGNPIAGSIAVLWGNKCWYLYGASSNEMRNLMPNYLLQWEMIKWALESGCDLYDFRGVPGNLDENNPMVGLYRFKKGFMGKYTEFVGMLDYVFNPSVYFCAEKGITLFRDSRRTLHNFKNRISSSNES